MVIYKYFVYSKFLDGEIAMFPTLREAEEFYEDWMRTYPGDTLIISKEKRKED